MSGKSANASTIIAQADGVAVSNGVDVATAIGIVLQDREGHVLARFSRPAPTELTPEQTQFQAIVEALDEAKRYGARNITIYSPNESLVREITGLDERSPELMKWHLQTVAHMNRYRFADVRFMRVADGWPPTVLARTEATSLLPRRPARQPSLFTAAA